VYTSGQELLCVHERLPDERGSRHGQKELLKASGDVRRAADSQ
jgi:hypothetical protein